MKKDYSYVFHYLTGLLFAAASVFDFIDNDISSGITYILIGILFIARGFMEQKNKGRNNKTK